MAESGAGAPKEGGAGEAATRRAMELIQASGVLNPDITLDKIMELTAQLSGLEDEAALSGKHVDTFIHRHFIFRHEE